MILSQSLRPHFEELIRDYVEMGKGTEAPLIPNAKDICVFNYWEELGDVIFRLHTHSDYIDDFQRARRGMALTFNDLYKRNYYPNLNLIINLLDEPVGLNFFIIPIHLFLLGVL